MRTVMFKVPSRTEVQAMAVEIYKMLLNNERNKKKLKKNTHRVNKKNINTEPHDFIYKYKR